MIVDSQADLKALELGTGLSFELLTVKLIKITKRF